MDRLIELAAILAAVYAGLLVVVLVAVLGLAGAVALGAADAWERWRVRRDLRKGWRWR